MMPKSKPKPLTNGTGASQATRCPNCALTVRYATRAPDSWVGYNYSSVICDGRELYKHYRSAWGCDFLWEPSLDGGTDEGGDMIPVLFVRDDSDYKKSSIYDCYDKARDAKSYNGRSPVIAHPPCRAWGVLSHMANPAPGEKELALWGVDKVRENGGILEHPKGSKLWRQKNLPFVDGFPDSWGGFCILIDQYDFGHVASKPTILYIKGCKRSQLPPIPKRGGVPTKSITGQVPNTKRCTQKQREYTPDALIEWMAEVVNLIRKRDR